MIVRKLRLRKGWSQDQLAELADVSVRTIQRVERGHAPSLETARALAAVFEVDVTTFTSEQSNMTRNEDKRTETNDKPDTDDEHLEPEEAAALEYAKGIKDFYTGVLCLFILAAVFFTAFGFDEPVLYVIFGGIMLGLAIQGLVAFEIIRMPFQNLEKRLAEKKLGRKL
jgi:transcriptional regulator with XRE-family HTH domain